MSRLPPVHDLLIVRVDDARWARIPEHFDDGGEFNVKDGWLPFGHGPVPSPSCFAVLDYNECRSHSAGTRDDAPKGAVGVNVASGEGA